jgi:hypothetical protein
MLKYIVLVFGRSSNFCGLPVYQPSGIELWAVEAFCLMPVIVCLFFVAGVVCVGDASVILSYLPSSLAIFPHNLNCVTSTVESASK